MITSSFLFDSSQQVTEILYFLSTEYINYWSWSLLNDFSHKYLIYRNVDIFTHNNHILTTMTAMLLIVICQFYLILPICWHRNNKFTNTRFYCFIPRWNGQISTAIYHTIFSFCFLRKHIVNCNSGVNHLVAKSVYRIKHSFKCEPPFNGLWLLRWTKPSKRNCQPSWENQLFNFCEKVYNHETTGIDWWFCSIS